jgi:RimJ/RimL family protein N-acetyltransferase
MERNPADTVSLRLVRADDLDIFYEHRRDPEAVRRTNFPAQSRDVFLAHWTEKILGDDTVTVRTVLAGDEVAGNVMAWWQDGRREVGYWLGRQFWGRSLGTGALRRFLEIETIRPLYATTDVGNVASRRLLERCRFAFAETVDTGDVRYDLLILK